MHLVHANNIRSTLLVATAATAAVLLGCVGLTPQTTSSPVGTKVELVASGGGLCPAPDGLVAFDVSGANTATPAAVTADANGDATLSYTGTNPGKDTVTVTVIGGTCVDNTDQASVTWTDAVGGAAELAGADSGAPLQTPGSSSHITSVIVAVSVSAVGAFVALGGAGWYVRRRWRSS